MGYPATDVKEFARQSVYIKNLGKLNDKINELDKKLNK
jgi:UDP-3-O-[3-hydroxymyristoyl] glucosamine N-acyltransferase